MKLIEHRIVFLFTFIATFQSQIKCNLITDLSEDEESSHRLSLNKTTLTAIVGTSIELPCNITSPLNEDTAYLILWFKDNIRNPVYSVDARLNNLTQADHLMADHLQARAFFNTSSPLSFLKIDPLLEEDNGDYKCRVDFKRGRTVYRMIKLIVLAPISKIEIFDHNGYVVKNIAGPYNEGSPLNLTCKSEGGNPPPNLFWYHGESLLDDSYFVSSKTSINHIYIPALTRDNLMMTLTCTAVNENMTQSLSSNVAIDLNLRVKQVKIISWPKKLSIDQSSEFVCLSTGSKPAPVLKWFIGDNQLSSTKETINENEMTIKSMLNLRPLASYYNKKLTCDAINSHFNDDHLKDFITLNISFPPLVYLAIGSNFNNDIIITGSDVFFECNVQSNPPAQKIGWTYNNVTLTKEQFENLTMDNTSLLIQNTQKIHKGIYKCWASNSEGKGESDPIDLNIHYAPTCKPNQQLYFVVNKNEQVLINCEVDAEPSNSLTFHWLFNNSLEEAVNIFNFSSKQMVSVMSYTPKVSKDYGSFYCWASNIVGDQAEPCIFFIIPAGPPDAPKNCSLFNATLEELTVQCDLSSSVDQDINYHLEMYTNQTKIYHLTSHRPSFRLRSIPFQQDYFFKIYSSNKKGQSSITILKANNSQKAELHINTEQLNASPSWLLLITLLAIIAIILLMITIIINWRKNSKKDKSVTVNHIINHSDLNLETTQRPNYANLHSSRKDIMFQTQLCDKNEAEMLITTEPFVHYMPYSRCEGLNESIRSNRRSPVSEQVFKGPSNFYKNSFQSELDSQL